MALNSFSDTGRGITKNQCEGLNDLILNRSGVLVAGNRRKHPPKMEKTESFMASGQGIQHERSLKKYLEEVGRGDAEWRNMLPNCGQGFF